MSLWQTLVASKYPNLASIPGPKPQFPIGNILDLRGHSARDMSEELARTYGPYAVVWIANQPTVWIHDPDAMLEVLDTKSTFFFKDEPVAAMTPGLGAPDAFTSNGAAWQQTRRDSFLSDTRMSQWFEDQVAPTRDFLLKRLERDLPFIHKPDVETWLYRLVFDLTCQMVLGRVVSDEAFEAYNAVMDAIDVRLSTNLPILPLSFAKKKKLWLDAVATIYEQVRKEPNGVSMAYMMSRYSRLPLGDQAGALANVFPGGVFSVTATLGHLLTQTRELAELQKKLPQNMDTYAALSACVPLEAYLRESFRASPPVPMFMRRVRDQAVRVGSITLDPAVRVIMGSAPLHRDANHWPEPLAFRPERWTPEVLEANPIGSSHLLPFGRGPRACHGQYMALFQLKMIMQALLTRPTSNVQCAPPTSQRFYWGCGMPQGLRGTIQ